MDIPAEQAYIRLTIDVTKSGTRKSETTYGQIGIDDIWLDWSPECESRSSDILPEQTTLPTTTGKSDVVIKVATIRPNDDLELDISIV